MAIETTRHHDPPRPVFHIVYNNIILHINSLYFSLSNQSTHTSIEQEKEKQKYDKQLRGEESGRLREKRKRKRKVIPGGPV